jgi:hypothetical protein
MAHISETEFARICDGIRGDRASIIEHNPIGPPEEILLWMLMSTLVIYLSLDELETPCFNGKPDAKTYRQAIVSIMKSRQISNFAVEPYLDNLVSE